MLAAEDPTIAYNVTVLFRIEAVLKGTTRQSIRVVAHLTVDIVHIQPLEVTP